MARIDGAALFTRVRAILTRPAETWAAIAAEPETGSALFMRYVVPLAAIRPICTFVHGQVFGWGMFGFSYRPGLIGGLVQMILAYVMALVGIVVVAFIAAALAPRFGGQSDRSMALRLIGYGATAAFAAGIFALIPGLTLLGLLGLYSLYLFYTGATPMLGVPKAQAGGFTAVTLLCAFVAMLVVGAITMPVMVLFGGGGALGMWGTTSGSTATGKLTIPGGGAIDLGQASQAALQAQDIASGKKTPADPGALQALLPASIGGYQRTATESSAMGAVGSMADGTYTAGGNSFHLKVSDMAAMGALAGLGTAFGVQENKQDADGYEKTGTVDGHLQSEEWHNASKSGKFSVVVASRYSIEADGSAASIDDLKAAVAAIDQGRLATLGH